MGPRYKIGQKLKIEEYFSNVKTGKCLICGNEIITFLGSDTVHLSKDIKCLSQQKEYISPRNIYYGEVVKKHKDRGRIRYLVNYTNEDGRVCEVYMGVVGWIESPPYWRFFKI